MDVIIDAISVSKVNIVLDKPFPFDDGMEGHDIGFRTARAESLLKLFIKYKYSFISLSHDGKFELEMDMLYGLNPIQFVDKESIFFCINLAKERISAVVLSLFGDTLNILEVDHEKNLNLIKEVNQVLLSVKKLL